MKIIYMGTPDFAVPALKALCEHGYHVPLVVTQPDKAKDRGKKIHITPVKEEAQKREITVLQPDKVKKNDDFLNRMKEENPDLIVVAAYGKILPKAILEIPRFGCINIHASLLPKYRGAAPIHRAIIDGEEKTGVTLMYMAEGMDTGDMIAKTETDILKKNVAQLHEELAQLGADLLIQELPAIFKGKNQRIKQDEKQATYAPMVFKSEGFLDFKKEPIVLERLIRGFNSWPGAHTIYKGNSVKIWEAEALEQSSVLPHGTIINVDKNGMDVAAGGKTLRITKLQFPGKRAMKIEDYIKGNKIEVHQILG
ncbi:methionyl-tRNA formyltransferase [Sinanaerobacter sp. ZZT-01]|uniref:methionyl-tRNA formyltransferase n=1 Tax=Sinanaerobacter sp. ZZT-01 TaxID=3111540 RepID=UPI002D79BD93|nr:methionyl-tRNA formyltransferase [Sinanaerobacter sp. ZZT-01]WRR92779.1 methionyl-tRNA formyltransferase [Sinanaerobacter sp. ZZT-01]